MPSRSICSYKLELLCRRSEEHNIEFQHTTISACCKTVGNHQREFFRPKSWFQSEMWKCVGDAQTLWEWKANLREAFYDFINNVISTQSLKFGQIKKKKKSSVKYRQDRFKKKKNGWTTRHLCLSREMKVVVRRTRAAPLSQALLFIPSEGRSDAGLWGMSETSPRSFHIYHTIEMKGTAYFEKY